MLEKIEKIKKFTQNHPKIFQQEYGINDVGIFLFKPIKIIKRALLFKIPFPNITFSKGFTKVFLALIGFTFLLILYFLVWDYPKIQVIQNPSIEKKDELTVEDKVRSTWINAIGGLFFFVTAYLAWKNSEISHKQLLATQEKQITERFSKAVEQLGNEESITVRLGAIYSLERIAKDSKYDHWTIMEVLTAFIREKSNDNREPDEKILQDIQAALTVIGRRKTENDPENARIDLRGANLNGANLSEAKLDRVHFDNAELNKAKFLNAHLTKARFVGTNLTEAIFWDAHLIRATFACVDLTKAEFRSANLTNASFFNNNFTDVKFFKADLTKAYFETADLTRTNFRQAKLIDAKFEGANFDGVNLAQADIEGVFFIDVGGESSITHNVFNLTNENLTIDNLTIEQIFEAKNWDKAKYNPNFEKQLQTYLSSLFSEFITKAIF